MVSLIDEVGEDLRRDRLFGLLRRWGWVAVLAVVLLVAGAAWNEWRRAQEAAAAQAFGDALLSALDQPTAEARRAALTTIDAEGPRAALVAMLAAEGAGATPALDSIAADAAVPQVYRQLATLKAVMAQQGTLTPDEVVDRLGPLLPPGAPFRLLAQEQVAIARAGAGQTDAAIETLSQIVGDGEVTRDLRRRAEQLIVALGGTLDAA